MKNALYTLLPCKDTLGRLLSARVLDRPVFIAGSGRSGTTALARALNQHPAIRFSANEAPLGLHIGEIAYEYAHGNVHEWYQENVNYSAEEMREQFRVIFYESIWGLHYGLRRNLGIFKGAGGNFRREVVWGTKTWPSEKGAEGMEWLFPKLRYIYIVRNGIDAVYSMTKFGGFAKRLSFQECCKYWVSNIKRLDYLRCRENALTIRYEDFLESPTKVLERIQRHVGVEMHNAPQQFAATTIVHPLNEATRAGEARREHSERGISYAHWTDTEMEWFKSICGPSMELMGYNVPF